MTALQPSSFNKVAENEESAAFYLLDEKIRRWVWHQGWGELRDAQEAAIPLILGKDKDIIIASATASGKTEAAFLPICTKLLDVQFQNHSVLYISPLKALINDQFLRMEHLCEELDIPVHPWHGDIPKSKKDKFIKTPTGILLITPESLEALFVTHGHEIPGIFEKITYVVIDELHSFIGSERGCQLQALIHRLEFTMKRTFPRIGLSATIGDMRLAADFLRPGSGENVELIISKVTGQELKLLLKGYLEKSLSLAPGSEDQIPNENSGSILEIIDSIYRILRGTSNLIFANSRSRVELFSNELMQKCEEQLVPNEFWPHHGNLSKELREDAETAIKDKTRPVNIVCTSTLELGIDIGSVNSIVQIGVPPSVASMRQRLGRSGRRGEPAVLRIFIQECEVTERTPPSDALRACLVQTIAMVRLLIRKWYEPPPANGLHLSTLVQQVLSLIAQYGGIKAAQAWNILCKNGPFNQISQQNFIDFLRGLGGHRLITQSSDGLLLHGPIGERIVNHHTFYAAFMTPEEYRLVSGERTIGTLPIDRPLAKDSLLIFGGRRWFVLNIDSQKKIIELQPASGGIPPKFGGNLGLVHDKIRQEMFEVYKSTEIPIFLDAPAKELLIESRENFYRYQLDEQQIFIQGSTIFLFTWMGDRVNDTIVALLQAQGFKALNEGIVIAIFNTSIEEIKSYLNNFISKGLLDTFELAKSVKNKESEKYDLFLTEDLLSLNYAANRFDAEGALKTIRALNLNH